MALIKKINAMSLFETFQNSTLRKDSFSYDACEAIVEFYEELDGDTEMDLVCICGEFTEYASAKEAAEDYFVEDEIKEASEDDCIDLFNSKGVWFQRLKNGNFLLMNL